MTRQALVWTEDNMIVSIGENLQVPNEDHVVIDVPDGIEDWRFSLNDDGEVVIAYEGQDTEDALASLLADQQVKLEEEEAAVIASRGE